MEWLWLFPILFFLILTHEFGHFLTACLFNVTVHEFGIGFPPKALVIAKRNGVEYTLNWLPIGGFVRMEGEEGPSADPNSFGNKPAWQRLIILASGSVVNLLTAVLIFIGLSLGGADVPQYQTGVWSLEPGGPAQQAGILPGDIILRANDKDIKTADDFRYVVTLNANTNVAVTIDRGGQQKVITLVPRSDPAPGQGATGIGLIFVYNNLKLGPLDPNGSAAKAGLRQGDVVTAIDDQPVQNSYQIAKLLDGKGSSKVTVNRNGQVIIAPVTTVDALIFSAVPDGSAAKLAGLKVDDMLTGINGKAVNNRYDVNQAIAGQQTVNISVTRGSNVVALTKVPVAALTNSNGSAASYTWLDGVSAYPIVHVDYNLADAIGAGFARTGDNVALVFNSLKAIAQGSQPIKNLAGPIGIGRLTAQVATSGGGFAALLALMGLLGANLFFVNMLPFPALDGGRFLFVLIEILAFGRRVPARIEMALNLAGMALLLLFIGYISYHDIIRTWFS